MYLLGFLEGQNTFFLISFVYKIRQKMKQGPLKIFKWWISELVVWSHELVENKFTWQSRVDPHLPVLLIRTQFPSSLSIFSAILWRVSWLTISIFLDLKNCAIKANGNFPKPNVSDKVFVTLNQALIQGCIEVQGTLSWNEWLKGEDVYYVKKNHSVCAW